LIDSDFLIFSDVLNKYWNIDCDLLIGESINDIYSQDRMKYLDRHVSDTGVKLYWATTVMFTKNQNTRLFFDTVNENLTGSETVAVETNGTVVTINSTEIYEEYNFKYKLNILKFINFSQSQQLWLFF
jgi:hypothetical protein